MTINEKIPLRKKLKALVKASLLGTVVLHLALIIGTAAFGLLNDPHGLSNFKFDVPSFLLTLVSTQVVWLIGLLLVGLPAWYLFERLGWQKKRHALLLGFVANGLIASSVYWKLPNFLESIKFAIVAGFALIGMLVAWYIWKQAYKTPMPAKEN
jgi:hypothetical protein